MARRRRDRCRPWRPTDRADTLAAERRPPVPKRSDEIVGGFITGLSLPSTRPRLRQWIEAHRIVAASRRMRGLSDEELAARVTSQAPDLLREGLRGRPLRMLAAGVREMTRRKLGLAQHPVQLLGGLAMLRGAVIEMATGEGKTVTNLVPVTAAALIGVPVHVVTVNDYLASRDCEALRPVLEAFGLRVAAIVDETEHGERPALYASDIVFTTNKAVAFDYLRDRMAADGDGALRALAGRNLGHEAGERARNLARGLGFAIVDEVDSVLIDEAQTPLIITAEADADEAHAVARAFLTLAESLREGVDFRLEGGRRSIRLLPPGEAMADGLAPPTAEFVPRAARHERLVQALSAIHLYRRDEHYIVRDGEDGPEVAIVDEFTGRVMADRQWQRGLHQMVEVKEEARLSSARRTIAQITYQTFFNRYVWFAGMTGTAREAAGELRQGFGRRVLRLPTHRRVRRRHRATRIYGTTEARWRAVLQQAVRLQRRGRPVLIGVRSVEASDIIASLLREAGIEPFVINARQDEDEAAVVARAGEPGRVTVATNMAGRGTDIPVPEEVERRGGLVVILTEFHGSSRIDRQLYGRSGRQGQRGRAMAMVSLEDSLFADAVPSLVALCRFLTFGRAGRLPTWMAGLLRIAAQARQERRARRRRGQVTRRARQLQRSLAFAPDGI